MSLESKFLAVVHHPWTLRLLTALAGGAAVGLWLFPEGSKEYKVCTYVVVIAAVFGVASPGLKGKVPPS